MPIAGDEGPRAQGDAPAVPTDRRRPDSPFQGLAEHSPVGLAIFQGGRLLYVNPEYCKIFGYSRDELVARMTPLDLVVEADRPSVAASLQARIARNDSASAHVVKGRRKDGTLIDLEFHWAVMEIGGTPPLIANLLVVTDREKTAKLFRSRERQIKAERGRAQEYLDVTRAIILVLDSQGKVALINRYGSTILGYADPADIIGKPWIDTFILPRQRDEMRAIFQRLLDGKDPGVAHHESSVIAKSGQERLIAWHNSHIRDDRGNIAATLSSGEDITELKRLDEHLRLSEDWLRLLFDEAPDAILVYDASGRHFIDANRAAEELFECGREELLRSNPQRFYPADQPDLNPEESRIEYSRRVPDGPRPFFKRHIRTAKGRDRHCEVRLVMLPSPGEQLIRASLTDVTEREAGARKIREGEAQFRALVEQGVAGIFVILSDMTMGYVNSHFANLLGYSQEEVVGHPLLDFIDEPDRPGVTLAARSLIAGRVPSIQLDTAVMRKDGGLTDLLAHGTMADFQGSPAIFGVAMDVSERKRAEETRTLLAAAVESSRSGIIGSDLAGICTSWNIGAERIYGYAAAEMIGRPIATLVPEARLSEPHDQILKVSAGGDLVNIETVRIHKDGRLIEVAETISPIKDAAGRVMGVSAVVTDVSQRKRTERDLHRATRALKTLSQANEILIRARSPEHLFQEMCRVIVDAGGYRMAWIGLVGEDPERYLRPVAHAGHEAGYLDKVHISWADSESGKGPSGTAARTRTVQVSKDIAQDPKMALWGQEAASRGYMSAIALPLLDQDKVLGVLSIYAIEHDAFGADEEKLLTDLSNDISYGLSVLRTRADHEAATRRLARAMEETVQAIADTIEMRDPYTAGHQRRVADISEAIAREMGLSEDRIHGLRLASVVHDLGKINIPAEILSKPGKLTALEYELIKTHPGVGYGILKPVEFPWPIADIILQHHERLDGSGYPNNLQGDAILLEAKIMAVADVVESMMSHRPYRAAIGIDRALAEIQQGSGRLFDPSAVAACVRLVRSGKLKLDV